MKPFLSQLNAGDLYNPNMIFGRVQIGVVVVFKPNCLSPRTAKIGWQSAYKCTN